MAPDILGVSGRAMLDALVTGTTDPQLLADLARGRLRAKLPAPHEALEGHFDAQHTLLVGAILAHLDFLDEQVELLSQALAEARAHFAAAVELLCSIPGLQQRSAEKILAEIGLDMSRFPSDGHLAPWAEQSPSNHESAGMRHSGRTRKGSKWLNQALKEAATATTRKNGSYLQALYRHLRPRLGHGRALVAVKHSMICDCWQMLASGELYHDPGGDYAAGRDPERQTRRLVRELEAL